MLLSERITQDMRAVMKAKDNATLSTLRLLLAAMKNKQIDVRHELSNTEVEDVVRSQVKQIKDAVELFRQGGREDLVTGAQTEIGVLEQYLPAQLTDEELKCVVSDVIQTTGAISKTDMGKVMGAAMRAVAGRADGARVKEIVGTLLSAFVPIGFGLALFALDAHAAIPLAGELVERDFASLGTGLRALRVLVLWVGILGITFILFGGFSYMKASYRDDEHKSALTFITMGVFASVAVFLMFGFSTIILQAI